MQERQTKQKQIIYDALKTLDHPTATEVYTYVHGHFPTVSRANGDSPSSVGLKSSICGCINGNSDSGTGTQPHFSQ